jgi:hypothetical protein
VFKQGKVTFKQGKITTEQGKVMKGKGKVPEEEGYVMDERVNMTECYRPEPTRQVYFLLLKYFHEVYIAK